MTERLSGGDMLIRALHDEGVEYIFGYPGGAALHIYDAIFRQQEIEHVLGDEVVRELERMLDDTTRDPHGKTIPSFADIHKPFTPSASSPSGYGGKS